MYRYGSCSVLLSGVAAIALLSSAAAPAKAATACAELAPLKIAPTDIDLPTSGAATTPATTQTVPADPAAPNGAKREYCKVLGAIAPVDRNAPPINFEVNLPAQWNGKAVQC